MLNFKFEEGDQNARFILYEDEIRIEEIDFKWKKEDSISIYHTLVDKEFQEKGYGKKLVDKVIEYARENQLNLTASCWFADKVIQSYHV